MTALPTSPASYGGPLIVLTDGGSYSGANLFAQLVQEFERGRVVGQTTGGGAGTPVTYWLTDTTTTVNVAHQ